MNYGEFFELHGERWMCVMDMTDHHTLACRADGGAMRPVVLVDVCVNYETQEKVAVYGVAKTEVTLGG